MIDEIVNFDSDADKAKLWAKLKMLKGKQTVEIKRWRKTRSLNACRFYWGVVIEHVRAGILEAWGENLSPDEVHLALKDRFMRRPIVDRISGEIKGYTHATTVVDTPLFSEYLEKVIKFAAEDLVVSIPSPNERHENDR